MGILRALPNAKPPQEKLNIAPEKWWLADYFPIGKVTFQGRTVKLGEGKAFLKGGFWINPSLSPSKNPPSAWTRQIGEASSRRGSGQVLRACGRWGS